jgi:hypothetical protein
MAKGGNIVKCTQKMSLFDFIKYHAYGNIKVALKRVGKPILGWYHWEPS